MRSYVWYGPSGGVRILPYTVDHGHTLSPLSTYHTVPCITYDTWYPSYPLRPCSFRVSHFAQSGGWVDTNPRITGDSQAGHRVEVVGSVIRTGFPCGNIGFGFRASHTPGGEGGAGGYLRDRIVVGIQEEGKGLDAFSEGGLAPAEFLVGRGVEFQDVFSRRRSGRGGKVWKNGILLLYA